MISEFAQSRCGRDVSSSVTYCLLLLCVLCAGCNSQKGTTPAPTPAVTRDQETPIPNPAPILTASMSCLSPDHSFPGEVAWDTALTLGILSNAVYFDGDQLKNPIEEIGATDIVPISQGLSHAVVASDSGAVAIAFRGTNQAADWLTNTQIMRHTVTDGSVHQGFYGAVDLIFEKVFAEAIRQGADKKAVWITGHSLGGAMAATFAYRAVIEKNLDVNGVVTFGQPLLFSNSVAQVMLNRFALKYVRFVNNWDPVTRLLPNYHHAGSRVHLTADGYQFRKPQISYSASPDATEPAPVLPFVEEAELRPMSDEEYESFQKQLQSEQEAPPPPPVTQSPPPGIVAAAAMYVPLLTPHRMGTYLDHLRNIGAKHLPSTGARVVKTGQAKE